MKKRALVVVFAMLFALNAVALASPVVLTIKRQHSDNACVSGQISLNGKIIGYTLERPWQGGIPLISSIEAGTYTAFVRTSTKDRWRIELNGVSVKDRPDRINIQLHVGNFVADSVGCVLVGRNLSRDLCHLEDTKPGFDNFKIEFAKAAGGEPDVAVQITIVITDYSK